MSNKLATFLSAVIALAFAAIGTNYILQDNSDNSNIIDSKTKKFDSKYNNLSKIETKSTIENVSNQVVSAPVSAYTAKVSSVIDCNNQTTAKSFIYCHESGNDPTKMNPQGCYGIGQDCNGIVYNKCGADYACQDEYFTEYMTRRYTTWENAKSFWLARTPINGKDVGNWW